MSAGSTEGRQRSSIRHASPCSERARRSRGPRTACHGIGCAALDAFPSARVRLRLEGLEGACNLPRTGHVLAMRMQCTCGAPRASRQANKGRPAVAQATPASETDTCVSSHQHRGCREDATCLHACQRECRLGPAFSHQSALRPRTPAGVASRPVSFQ
eukprot:124053-Chlamydomonas_euryale.AAC.8